MISFIRVIVRQRAAVILFALILLAAGGFTATRLQEELLPNVSFNTVTVVTADPGASPNTVLKDVTKPVEVAVAGVPGINTLASTSARNASVVTVQFNYGTDINQAESKISTAVAGLPFPTGVLAPKVSTVDFSAFPILYLGVNNTDGKASLQDTYTLVNTQVKPQLEQISGVAAADVGGGANPRVTVTLNPTLMAKYGVTPAQVNQVLQANNVGIPGGNVTNNGVTEPVVTNGTLDTLTAIRDLPITVLATSGVGGASSQSGASGYTGSQSGASGSARGGYAGNGSGVSSASTGASGGSSASTRSGQTGSTSATSGYSSRAGAVSQPRVVYLRDVATVSEGAGNVNVLGNTPGQIAGIVRFNGKPAISITIRKNSDANIVKVADGVQAKITSLEKQYPQIHISTLFDSSTGIVDSVSGLVRDGLFGALFAILVIFLFLRTVRTTLVTAVSIPLSIFTALLILGWQGITLNIMTISAVAVAIGRVVDDAIVVLENIYRHVQEGEERIAATINGTREVGRAIIGSTVTTIAVFLPIGFVGGIIGQFFQPFAFTVAFALAASLLVALTVIPALGSLFITRKVRVERETVIQRVYTPVLTWALAHRAITVVVALVLFVGSLGLAAGIPKGFLPPSNANLAQVSVALPAGASLGRTTAVVARVERDVLKAKQPGLKEYESIIGYDSAGAQRSGSGSADNAATMLVVYNSNVDMTKAIKRLNSDLAPYNTGGTSIKGAAVQNGPPTNVDVQVTGSNQSEVTTATQQVLSSLAGVKGLTDLQSNLQARQPQLEITVDARKAFLHGLTPATAALAIRGALTGQTATTVRLHNQSQDADIYVQVDPNATNTAAKIQNLTIGTPPVAVGQIASVTPTFGPVSIARQGQQNIGDVTAGVDPAASSGTVTGNVSKAIKPLTARWAKSDITVGQAGVGQQLIDGFINMGIAMLVAIGLVYLIMVVLFRSLLIPFVILFSLPLAVIGALVGLAVTGKTLDLSALIGMLMLIGIVVTNAIVLLDLVQHKLEAGAELHQALIEGGRTRVRPILMTATATILALVPLAIQNQSSGLIAGNLATVVIGGLLTSTLLTLVVVPVIYSLFMGLRGRVTGGGALAFEPAAVRASGQRGSLTPDRVAFTMES